MSPCAAAPRVRIRPPPRLAPPARIPSAIRSASSPRGDADAMICGGTEACITPMGIGGFAAMRALSTGTTSRSAPRAPGTATATGSWWEKAPAFWCWRNWRCARQRGARILAEIVGYGMSGDAYHVTAPPEDGDGAFRVMRNALRDAGIGPEPGGLHQRPRHVHRSGRPRRDGGHQARLRRTRLQVGGEFHQVHDRPPAGRRRGHRSRHHRAGHPRPDRAADHQLRKPGSACAIWTTCPTRRGP